MNEIPLYSCDGHIEAMMDEFALMSMPAVRLVRNRRGHLKRAIRTGLPLRRPLSQGNAGQTYVDLTIGPSCWTMVLPPIVRT